MFRRIAIAGLIAAGTLFAVQVVATAIVVFQPAFFQRQIAEAEELTEPGAFSWLLSKLSMVPAGPAPKTVVAVMIENSSAARESQAGLDKALAIIEMVVEGGITRFVVLLDVADLPERAGPVRSLRTYFLGLAEHWSSLLLFAGGSPEALEQAPAADIPVINGLGRPKDFTRDNDLPAPHNLFVDAESMRTLADEKEAKMILWPPYVVGSAPKGEAAKTIDIEFFSALHDVTFTSRGRTYERVNGEIVSPAAPANVIVLEAPIASVGEFGRLDIPLNKGDMVLFRGGFAYKGTWKFGKDGLAFAGLDDAPLRLARGQTWITVLPRLDRVSWK